MQKEKTQEMKALATLLSDISAGLKSKLSPELAIERAITNHKGPLKPLLSEIRRKLVINSLTPTEALNQLSQKIQSQRLRIILQILSSTLQKNAEKTGEIIEEILPELIEDIKLIEEREHQLKAQEIKLKIIIFTSACAQGTLSALIPQLKLLLTNLLPPPEQTWIPLIFAATITLTTYTITRTTNLNPITTPLTSLSLFLTSFYLTSTLTKTLLTQNILTWPLTL